MHCPVLTAMMNPRLERCAVALGAAMSPRQCWPGSAFAPRAASKPARCGHCNTSCFFNSSPRTGRTVPRDSASGSATAESSVRRLAPSGIRGARLGDEQVLCAEPGEVTDRDSRAIVVDSGAAECADLDGALPLGARVLQLAEPLALGAGVDEQ